MMRLSMLLVLLTIGGCDSGSSLDERVIPGQLNVLTELTEYEDGQIARITVANGIGRSVFFVICKPDDIIFSTVQYREREAVERRWIGTIEDVCINTETQELEAEEVLDYTGHIFVGRNGHPSNEHEYRFLLYYRNDREGGINEMNIPSNSFTIIP